MNEQESYYVGTDLKFKLVGVASSGTFVMNSAAEWTTTGNSGIPTGWTVVKVDS